MAEDKERHEGKPPRRRLVAKPRPDIDRHALIDEIMDRYSVSLEYLAQSEKRDRE